MAEPFVLRFEWADGTGVREPALAATMARLEARVGAHCLTLAHDRASRGVVEGALVSLLPLATWAVDCWWFALYERPRPPGVRSLRLTASPEQARWHRRHGWLPFREGFALPDVVFAAESDTEVRLDWFADPPEAGPMPLAFLGRGSARVSRAVAEEQLAGLVEAVLTRCEGLDDARLQCLRHRWEVLRTVSQTEAAACRRAARLGLDALDADEIDDSLAQFLEAPPPVEAPIFDELLDVADDSLPMRLAAQGAKLARLLEEARRTPRASGVSDAWQKAQEGDSTAGIAQRPFELGYLRAQRLRREVLGLNDQVVGAALDEALDQALLTSVKAVEDAESFLYPGVKALVAHTDAGPFVATRPLPAPAGRFDRARSLHMLLFRARPGLVTTSFAPDQQASRAFAAEMLAPAAWLRARLRGVGVDWETVREFAEELRVGDRVVGHQVENHGLAEVVDG